MRGALAAALCATAIGCSDDDDRGGGTPDAGAGTQTPIAATDDDVGSWADDARLVLVTDRCAGRQSVEMASPGGRVRFDSEPIAVVPGANPCVVEQAYDDAGEVVQ